MAEGIVVGGVVVGGSVTMRQHTGHPIRSTVLAVVGALGIAVVVGAMASRMQLFDGTQTVGFLLVTGAAWILFAASMLLLARVPRRAAPAVVIVGSLLIGGAALLGPPNTSTDSARYSWDGILQSEGISPYAEVPAADALAPYRTDWLFPTTRVFENGTLECAGTRIENTRTVPDDQPLCTAINRPQVPTIYPPLAEQYFAAVRSVVPVDAEYWPFQVGGLAISLSVTGLLLVALRRTEAVRWAAVWGWCPFVATEAVTNSHVDVLGVALALAGSLVAVTAARRRMGDATRRTGSAVARLAVAGALLGAAIAAKLVPVIVTPPLLRIRRAWTMVVAAIAVFAALYVPYVLQSGPGVLGYLPGYLGEEGYQDGSAFALASTLLPGPAAILVSAVVLAIAAVLSVRYADPRSPWIAQVAFVGTVLLVVSPRYGWYALLVIPFIVLSRRWEWFVVPLALSLDMIAQSVTFTRWSLALAAIAVTGGFLLRRALPDAFLRDSPSGMHRRPY